MPGLHIEFDASRGWVLFLCGPLVVDYMGIGEFKQEFGVVAVRQLIHGCLVTFR
jgi:hypothetical protein